jgi:hypothetical protein
MANMCSQQFVATVGFRFVNLGQNGKHACGNVPIFLRCIFTLEYVVRSKFPNFPTNSEALFAFVKYGWETMFPSLSTFWKQEACIFQVVLSLAIGSFPRWTNQETFFPSNRIGSGGARSRNLGGHLRGKLIFWGAR